MIDNKLLTLITVAETGSFSKAARILNLTQPAVSNHIRQLENELGIKIFNKANNSIKLSNEGVIALHYAKRIQAIYAKMQTKIDDAKTSTLSLTVGITHTAESSAVMEALAKYANDSPLLRITFITGAIKDLYDQLNEYSIDMAVVEGKNRDPKFNALLLDNDSLLLALSPENHLANQTSVSLDQLRKEKMILRLPNSGTRQLFEASIAAKGLSLRDFDINIESDSLFTIKDLIEKNIGVSVLGRSSCLDEERAHKIVLLPIEGLNMVREVNIIYPKDFEHPEVLTSIVETYHKAAKNSK